MNNDRADGPIAIALPGFNDLERSVTPILLLMDHLLYRFSTISKKNEENLSIKSLKFLQNALSSSVLFSPSFSCSAVSNASSRVKSYIKDGNTRNYLRTDQL